MARTRWSSDDTKALMILIWLTGIVMNSSKSKTGLLISLQQDQDFRPSWNTWRLRIQISKHLDHQFNLPAHQGGNCRYSFPPLCILLHSLYACNEPFSMSKFRSLRVETKVQNRRVRVNFNKLDLRKLSLVNSRRIYQHNWTIAHRTVKDLKPSSLSTQCRTWVI